MADEEQPRQTESGYYDTGADRYDSYDQGIKNEMCTEETDDGFSETCYDTGYDGKNVGTFEFADQTETDYSSFVPNDSEKAETGYGGQETDYGSADQIETSCDIDESNCESGLFDDQASYG